MSKTNPFETDLLNAYESGQVRSVASKSELARIRAAAAGATALKDKRVNIRLSSGDLNDIQVKALEEGIDFASVSRTAVHAGIESLRGSQFDGR